MRWILVALACVACKKPRDTGPGSAVVEHRPIDAAVDATRDAPADAPADATPDAPPDAAIVRVRKSEVEHLLDWETIGPLKLGMVDKQVLGILGEPKERPEAAQEGATGEFVTDWAWTGVDVGMAGDKAMGPFHVRSISVLAPSTFATSHGVHIGSTLAEVRNIYPRNTEEGNADPNQYLVGSVYGGMLFTMKSGKVASIFLGAMAF